MSSPPKVISIIKALETIHSTSFEQLCSDLIYHGALIPDLEHKLIYPTGLNISKNFTIRAPADAVIDLKEGLCVCEFSRAEDWIQKLKHDIKSISKWMQESEPRRLARLIFITTRDIGNKTILSGDEERLPPEKFVEKKFSQFNIQAHVFGQKHLLRVLRNREYSEIRREWLGIPEDYFLSLESFESNHIKQAQDRHIYLEKFVETPSRKQSINVLEKFVAQPKVRVLLVHAQVGIGKTRFVLEILKRVRERTKDIDILFNQTKKRVNVDEVIPEISKDRKSLIVLDDVHEIDDLTDFKRLLSEREHTQLVLVTRSTAQATVKQQIESPMEELKLSALDREASLELLKDNLETSLLDQDLRHLARACEENPLLIGITTHLINTGVVPSAENIKGNDLIKDYFETILAELKQSNQVPLYRYEPYLALLYLLKPFSISNVEKRLLIRSMIDIDEVQEGFVLRHLEECAILERHGDTLWIYPDLLGEYLVTSVFFSDIPILDFDKTLCKITQFSPH